LAVLWYKKAGAMVKKIFYGLSVLLFPFVMVIVLYGVTINQKELFPGGGYWFSIAANLSEAYVASYIFFCMVQYLPWKKNRKNIKDKIFYHLLRLKFDTKELVIYLLKFSDYNCPNNILDYDSNIELPEIINFDLTKKQILSLYVGSVCQYIDDPKTGIEIAVICIRNFLSYLKDNSYYLDDELIRILTDIDESELIESLEFCIGSEALLKKVIDTRVYELNQFIHCYRNLSRYIEKHFSDADMEKINGKLRDSQKIQDARIKESLKLIHNSK
jgi:hypothetical protein